MTISNHLVNREQPAFAVGAQQETIAGRSPLQQHIGSIVVVEVTDDGGVRVVVPVDAEKAAVPALQLGRGLTARRCEDTAQAVGALGDDQQVITPVAVEVTGIHIVGLCIPIGSRQCYWQKEHCQADEGVPRQFEHGEKASFQGGDSKNWRLQVRHDAR
jgi:hypothetical protein